MAMPPQAGPAAAPEAASPSQLLKTAHEALMKLGEVVVQSDAPPELKKKLGMLIQAVEMLGQEMAGGAAPQKAPPMRGNVAPEAGANPNARPMI